VCERKGEREKSECVCVRKREREKTQRSRGGYCSWGSLSSSSGRVARVISIIRVIWVLKEDY
jgi:hypothetical protein